MKKVKIIATICSLVMAIAMLGFATFAAFSPEVTLNGNISATAELSYSLSVKGAAGADMLVKVDGDTTETATEAENEGGFVDSSELGSSGYNINDIEMKFDDDTYTLTFTFRNDGDLDLSIVSFGISEVEEDSLAAWDITYKVDEQTTENGGADAPADVILGTDNVVIEVTFTLVKANVAEAAGAYNGNPELLGEDFSIGGAFTVDIDVELNETQFN